MQPTLVCDCCGERLDPRQVTPEPGPGAVLAPEPAVATDVAATA